jgi:hypothetical protein
MSTRLRSAITALTVIAASLFVVTSAQAEFGASAFNANFVNEDGSIATQAGSHPFAFQTGIELKTHLDPIYGKELPDQNLKDLDVTLPEGFTGTDTALPKCSTAEFLTLVDNHGGCPDDTAVGASVVRAGLLFINPVYNLVPPPGVVVKLGFYAFSVPVVIEVGLDEKSPYRVVSKIDGISQAALFERGRLELWSIPSAPAHDPYRGGCLDQEHGTYESPFHSRGICESNAPEVPFFTLPRSCQGPARTDYSIDSWQNPGARLADGDPDLSDPAWVSGSFESVDTSVPPVPQPLTGCSKLGFSPSITAQPTTKAAESPTGLDFSLDHHDEGLTSPTGLAQSDFRKAVVTLPEGFSVNPSIAEGLNVCSEADLERETSTSEPGAGCPDASKIGTVEVETPLLDENVNGSLYQATPYENPFHSLIALYIVIKNPTLGIKVVQPLNVISDPQTGRLTTVSEEMPQLPFSHFRLHFREGTRSPLASPPGCGTYNANAVLTPWSGGPPVETTSAFEIISGSNGSSCPSGGTPPFHPGLEAGTINNAAGRYSPFYLHLTRKDGEQEITHFSIKLPPGVSGKLAGIPFCSDAAIAAATARTGPHGGQEEVEHPSCPAASEIGHTLVGAGVGPSLAYVPGKVYLAGPYHGSALSIVAITAAKTGPFDLGTVVVREALKVNPETAEVFVDATGSDPLPHIIKGIPVHLRDIRVYVDRPEFVINPTSCERTSTASTVLGSGTDFASEADDRPITVTSRFQAADCAGLAFRPKLTVTLKGGTKRSANPALKAVVTPGKGNANIAKAQVTLPHSEFLEQGHIKTVCTRVQFNAGGGNGEQCPAASVYGRAVATTPLLSEPLSGPVYLRSSSHALPDLVAALHSGEINIVLDGRIDSAHGGGIRTNFEAVPDAPVTKFTLEMFGGKKSLLANSTNICKGTHRATAEFTGQNGKRYETTPALKAQCGKKGGKGKKSTAKKGASDLTTGSRLLRLGW